MSARVKKLEWERRNETFCVAESVLGQYQCMGGYVDAHWICRSKQDHLGRFDSLAEAQSACQSHYEKAVMAFLEDDK